MATPVPSLIRSVRAAIAVSGTIGSLWISTCQTLSSPAPSASTPRSTMSDRGIPSPASRMPTFGTVLAPVPLAERDLQVLRLVGMVGAVLRPVASPLLDVAADAGVTEDRLPVRQVVDSHQVEVRELLPSLDALGDAPAGVVEDVRVLAEVWVVDLADELAVLLLVELAGGVREQHELLGHSCLL